jgi:hypothetical protein
MQLKVDGDLLSTTIKTMQKVVQAQQVSIKVSKNSLAIIGVGNGNSFSMSCECQVTGKSKNTSFTIGVDNILNAISKRKSVQIEIQESAIIVTEGRYSAELLVQPTEEIEIVPAEVKEGKDSINLKDKFLNAVRENLPKLELKPLLAMYDYIPFGIKATKEGTFMACFDAFQAAFFMDKELTGNIEFTLPSNVFSMLARELKGQDYKMAVTDSTIYAYNDLFELALARPQTEGQQVTLENMIDLYATLKKDGGKSATTLKLKKEGISSILENAKAVYEKDSTFTFTTKGDKCKLELKSSYGKVSSMIMLEEKPEKDVSFSCDFNFFSTLLAKAPATVTLRINDRMMLFNNKPVTYLMSLV